VGEVGSIRKLSWIGGIFGVYALVWYTHVALSAHSDPLGARFDSVLWAFASVLKILATLSTLWLLGRVHRGMYHSRAVFSLAIKTWTVAAISVLVLLAVSRSWWAPLLTTSSAKYYYIGDALRLSPDIARHRAAWAQAWSRGVVLAAECALVFALSAIQAAAGFRFGNRPVRSVMGACLLCYAVLGAYLAWSPWFLASYDFFHGDLLSGALLWDQVAVLANDPYTSLTLPLYFVLALCHVFILRSSIDLEARQARRAKERTLRSGLAAAACALAFELVTERANAQPSDASVSGPAAAAPAQTNPARPKAAEQSDEPNRHFSFMFSPLPLLRPLVEVTAEVRAARHFGLGLLGGIGELTLENTDPYGDRAKALMTELGAQLNWYPGKSFHGYLLSAELLWAHVDLEAVNPRTGTVSASGTGVAVGPVLGYKYVHASGFTLVAGLGFRYALLHGQKKSAGGTSEDFTEDDVFLRVKFELGWSL
jgi:hypothetical protein